MNEHFEVWESYSLKIEWNIYEKLDEWSDSFVYVNRQTKQVLKIYHSLRIKEIEHYYFLMKNFEIFLHQKFLENKIDIKIKVRKPIQIWIKQINDQNWVFSESDFVDWKEFRFLNEKKYDQIHQKVEKLLGEFLWKKSYKLNKRNIKLNSKWEIILIDIWNEIPKFLADYENRMNFKISLRQILWF